MIIKTYIVNDMKEALIRASYELGKEAVIISQRPIRVGKWYNPFKKKKLEVTVAVESNKKKQPAEKVVVNNETRYSVHNLIEKNPVFKNISDTTKSQLLGYCKLHLKEDEYLTTEEIKNFMKMAFKDNGFEKKVRTRKVNVFVGPTGVGKTTTIAKIAARESLEKTRSEGLFTIY